MLLKTRTVSSYLHNLTPIFTPPRRPNPRPNLQAKPISSLKVAWRKDRKLDQAIDNDKRYKVCARVVKEVLNEPGQVIPLRYLEKRRERLRLNVKVKTFLTQNPGLFDVYYDRIRPKSEPVRFLRVSDRLRRFLGEEKKIFKENEVLIVSKLCKLLMMSKDKLLSAEKLAHVKREFGFPNDFLDNLVPRYSEYFRLIRGSGEGNLFLELVSWNPEFAKSVIEKRAEEESELTGIRVRPNFHYELPQGFFLKKEMREWVRDWLELDYISPYEDVSHLDQASPEMEKRSVGVFHELLSLSILKRVPVPILGKFSEEYRFSNAFSSVFTRHSGIFYLSLKGGIKTALLREAYKTDQLVDSDPLLAIKDKFAELLEEGWRECDDQLRLQREERKKDMIGSNPKSKPVRFLRIRDRLKRFLEEEERIVKENEGLIVSKLCKLLMMSKDKVLSTEKLVNVKREFGFPNDFLVNLVPKYSDYFRLIKGPREGNSYLQLVSWNPEFAKSVIKKRAEEESELTGIQVQPNFHYDLPEEVFLKKEMREWISDWLELDYISPYEDVSHLDQASSEMEKRSVGVLHELLSLSILKKVPVPILGKFSEEYRFSNAFSSVFTRHSGIFYISLKGGIRTAVLREAYRDKQLVDHDPLLEIKSKLVELLEEGWQERDEQWRLQRRESTEDMKMMAARK
ncbi:hypothetical protein TIFTF001_017915 [Ficus carica]|uniref:PORR domain-containing protein n=1 Tax=Ficus carica TaxID=3494 RepID=A0AA88AD56_FICCA|nr:hypothetical protein TIFTF001_017915 [Ficus carica]